MRRLKIRARVTASFTPRTKLRSGMEISPPPKPKRDSPKKAE